MKRLSSPLPDARIWSVEECAARLNKSVPWFYEHKPRLEQLGMPKKDRELGGWDLKAFEAWLDCRSGLIGDSNIENKLMDAIRG